jgi:hypothetical protein
MNCREFHRIHLDFTDGTLAPDECAAARAHLEVCPGCAQFDCRVRRAALLVRNLPPVRPRPGFSAQLAARLAAPAPWAEMHRRRAYAIRAVAAAASVLVVAGLFMLGARRSSSRAPAIVRPLAAATAVPDRRATVQSPFVPRDPMVVPAAGFPLWPAAAAAGQAPVRFAVAEAEPLPLAR